MQNALVNVSNERLELELWSSSVEDTTVQIFQIPRETLIWLDLSIRSMLERLVLKNAAECTSQRLKWTSGARVMIIFGRLVSVARSLGRSVARSLGRSVARSLDRSIAQSLDR